MGTRVAQAGEGESGWHLATPWGGTRETDVRALYGEHIGFSGSTYPAGGGESPGAVDVPFGGQQLFAINVFKVRRWKLPHLNKMPGAHHNISGVANIRGVSIPVINLRGAIGMRPMAIDHESNLIITEYNRTIQGFLVDRSRTSST